MRSATVREELAAADEAAPVVIFGSGYGNGGERVITVGKVVYLVAVPPAGAIEELLMAFSARATATVTGNCLACGAGRHVSAGSRHIGMVTFHHERDCPAGDDNILAALRAEGFGAAS